MRMELIQPFINAADAVFAESLQAPTKIVDLTMDENTYRRKGIAALILIPIVMYEKRIKWEKQVKATQLVIDVSTAAIAK